ncbi:hypothetical protein N0V83_001253 [Neocucurbitaria cava]|uniref:Uncharacterized protein n=1 Tax=Neocucurbitaria cava TaxID=798079 RepID=A0A9W8YEW9_9PLEO|nr:hypothetical protein N0V83_001253 [Neocucurbitaria cava]
MFRIPAAVGASSSRVLCGGARVRVNVVPQTLSTKKYSSQSPTGKNKNPPEHFNKTGEKEQDPVDVVMGSREYSQSGGDDVVAQQDSASFKNSKDTDPASQKDTAGKGNVVNPLELSPASPELSKYFDETDVSKSADREPGAKTGQGISRKAKVVEKNKIDFK